MSVYSMIKQSFGNIWHNGFRSFLTVLGIVIGIAAVISLMGLGRGLQESVTSSIGDLGTTNVTVSSADPERQTAERQSGGGGRGGGPGGPGGFTFGSSEPTITIGDYEQILAISGVAAASPTGEKQLDLTKKSNAATATAYNVLGVDNSYESIKDLTVADGVFLTQKQVDDNKRVVVLGADVSEELYGSKNPVGRDLYLSDQAFTVVGVLAPDGGDDLRNDTDDQVMMGFARWLKVVDATAFATVSVVAVNEDSVEGVVEEIDAELTAAHGIGDGENPDFAVTSSVSLLETRSDIVGGFTNTLTGIAAISLLVGGIGIMNIMLVTVTERTREIGLRRAVGAKSRHILAQFLTESVVLTTIGGLIGLVVGYMFSTRISSLISFGPPGRTSDLTTSIDPQIAAMAVVISVAVGIVFGMFPAYRAARLDPATALRYE
jgi:putative ABC transport system permease protein